jgi:hypothetical protein
MTEEEWLSTPNPERLSQYLAETASDRTLTLLAAACCRRLMPWNKQSRVLEALCRVERYADGELAGSTMEKWSRQMWRAMRSTRNSQDIICWAVGVACGPRRSPEFVNHWQSMVRSARGFSPELVQELPTLVRVTLHEIVGNPFHSVSIDPAWLTTTVTDLATVAYNERFLQSGELDTARLAVLADALEEASCSNPDILGHLRSHGPHVRGCWAVDLLLGKE